jgi:hypothetical protein
MRVSRRVLACSFLAVALVAGSAFGADQRKAEKTLKDALAAGNAEGVQNGCDELLECNTREALLVVLSSLPKAEGSIYWQLVGAASGFKNRGALEELGKFILSNQGSAKGQLPRDLLFGLQNNGSQDVAVALAIVLEKGKYDLQLMAADQLAQVRSTESIDALIAGLKREEKGDPELRRRIEGALQHVTGQSLGDVANWDGWWKKQRSSGAPTPAVSEGGGGAGATKTRDDEFKQVVEKADPKHIVVLAAYGEPPGEKAEPQDSDYDRMQGVLSDLKIPHIVVKRKCFEDDPEKYLKDCWALLINCHQINTFCICPKCHPGGDKNNRLMHCTGCNEHQNVSYKLKSETLDHIKRWTEAGGYLYTEDWGIVETTGVLWPEKIGSGQVEANKDTGKSELKPRLIRKAGANQGGYEEHVIVKLTPSKGSTSHPLMRGVWQRPKKETFKPKPMDDDTDGSDAGENKPAGGPGAGQTVSREDSPAKPLAHVWQVDDESPAIEVKDKTSVIVLLESAEVGGLADGNTAVAVTFRTGSGAPAPKRTATGPGSDGAARGTGEWSQNSRAGRVLHTLSHFGHQSQSEDGQALYNLLVNFLLEANKHHEQGPPAKK